MIADIFYLIFILTITVTACFIRKKKIVRGFHTHTFTSHHPGPPASIVFGFAKNRCAHIFSLLSPVWAASVLFNFYLKVKQRFSVWGFTKNASFMFFHGGIWSRYSEINKIKTKKDLSFRK